MVVSPDNTTPTVLGLLAIGKSPQDFLPGAYIQFLRLDGLELADPVVDEENMGGTLVEMLRRTEEKLKAHNRIAIDITSAPTHIKTMPYPSAAIQQILYNAVLHRTYESTNAPVRVYWFNDRIEINSPGGPYGNVTIENFGKPGITDYPRKSSSSTKNTKSTKNSKSYHVVGPSPKG
jgi:ATP-dependent DNA helicase RecG